MLILSISHHICLDKTQRYALINEESINAMGVSVPVWIRNNGMSTEPAVEVFCNYELTNEEKKAPIGFKQNGYKINMPQLSKHEMARPRLNDEIWRSLTIEERNEYYQNQPVRMSADWLKDIEDGGSMRLRFREHNKIFQNEDSLEVYHYVQIDDVSRLIQSLC